MSVEAAGTIPAPCRSPPGGTGPYRPSPGLPERGANLRIVRESPAVATVSAARALVSTSPMCSARAGGSRRRRASTPARRRRGSRGGPPRRAAGAVWAPGGARPRARPRRTATSPSGTGVPVSALATATATATVGARLLHPVAPRDARVHVEPADGAVRHAPRAPRAASRAARRRGRVPSGAAPGRARLRQQRLDLDEQRADAFHASRSPRSRAVPGARSARNIADGSATSVMPASAISKTPSSSWCRSGASARAASAARDDGHPRRRARCRPRARARAARRATPSLVTWPTSTVAMARSFARRTSRCAPSRTWPTEPGRGRDLGIEHRLDGVDREHVGRDLGDARRAIAGSDVSATTSSEGASAPSRPARSRTCSTDSSAHTAGSAVPAAAMRPIAWSSSVLLPMPGSPPSSVTEPGDEAAAEDAVELAAPRWGGRPRRSGRPRPAASRRRRSRSTRRGRRRTVLHQARPRAALGAAAQPLRRLGVALACSGRPGAAFDFGRTPVRDMAGTLSAGCDHTWGTVAIRTIRPSLGPPEVATPLGRVRRCLRSSSGSIST